MSLADYYQSLVEKIKSVVEGTGVFKEVHIGWKERVDAFPSAFIIPAEVTQRPVSTQSEYRFRFAIQVVDRKSDPLEGLKAVMSHLCKVSEALTADRTLGGLCLNLEVLSFSPFERVSEMLNYWGSLSVVCLTVRD